MRPRSAHDPERPRQTPAHPLLPRRLRREQRTVEVMIRMYCRDHHGQARSPVPSPAPAAGTKELCPTCGALLEYSHKRVSQCRFGEHKPTCARCATHCFRAREREQIRTVMRYAGPRMIRRHTYLAVRYLLDRRRSDPAG
jgi:hypothetical protein